MILSKIAIKRPVGMAMIALSVIFLGAFFLSRLSVDLLPRITYPLVAINVSWPGAAAEEVEQNVTQIIEAGVATTDDAITVLSSSMEGNAAIAVYFEYGKDMDVALADTKSKLDQIRRKLPTEVAEPNIFKAEPALLPIMDIAFFSKTMNERELRNWVENDLSDYFLGIPGLASVTAYGGKVREIQVVFNQEMLRRLEISADQLLTRIKAENIDVPLGRIITRDKEYSARLTAQFRSIDEIKNIVVANRQGRIFKMRDVARVYDAHEEQRVLTRLNGKPSVMMSFFKQPNANTVTSADRIGKRLKELKRKKVIPPGTDSSIVSNQAAYIQSSVGNVGVSAIVGGLLAIIIIWLFLHSIKRTLVIALAIPVSILGTFILMDLADVTLNIFSLGGLVLAVGMLVDNSVVMLENVTRHQREGENSVAAAEDASREVGGALVASTVTNLVAVAPFFFIQGIAALLFRDMIITIAVAFIISLVVGLTVVPTLGAYLFKKKNIAETSGMTARMFEKAVGFYRRLLGYALKLRVVVIALAVIALLASLFTARTLGSEFLPGIDDGQLRVKVKMPVGTPLEKNKRLVEQIEKTAKAMPGVKTVSTIAGGYWKRKKIYDVSHESDLTIKLVEKSRRPVPTRVVVKQLQKKMKKLGRKHKTKIKVMPPKLRGIKKTSTADIDIRIKGPRLETLHQIAKDTEKRLHGVQGLANLDISLDMDRPEMHISLKRQRLSDFSLTAEDVAAAVRTAVDGTVVSQFTDPKLNQDYDIRVLAPSSRFRTKAAVQNIALYPPSGVDVRLWEVAHVRFAAGAGQIDRQDQRRLIEVTGDAVGRNVGKVTDDVKKKMAGMKLPAGYHIEYGGEEEAARESNQQLLIVIILAVFMVFVVMAVQYESLLDPFIIMLTLPLSLIGAILALKITGTPVGATVILGLILLVGIVINNAIVMVEYINQLRRGKNASVREAVIEGAALRLRPILMTSLTTIIGLTPLVLGWGEGLEMIQPLAVTFVGGMIVATFLTLFIIPCIYSIFHRMKKI